MTTSTSPTVAAIVSAYLALADHRRRAGLYARQQLGAPRLWSSANRGIAYDAVSEVLSPIATRSRVCEWLVAPREGESIHAYARRASRCLAARCAQAGVAVPPEVSHAGSETIGAIGGHVGDRSRPIASIGRLERAVQRLEDANRALASALASSPA